MKYIKISIHWVNIIYVLCSIIMIVTGLITSLNTNWKNDRMGLLGILLIGIGAYYITKPFRTNFKREKKKVKDKPNKKLNKWVLILALLLIFIPIVNLIFDLIILDSNLNNLLVLFLMLMVNISSGIFMATIVIGLIILILISKNKKLQEGIVSLYANHKKNR